MSEEKLRPCFRCGSEDVELVHTIGTACFARCANCFIRTRNHAVIKETLFDWNSTEWDKPELKPGDEVYFIRASKTFGSITKERIKGVIEYCGGVSIIEFPQNCSTKSENVFPRTPEGLTAALERVGEVMEGE